MNAPRAAAVLRLREEDVAPTLIFVALAALACFAPPQSDTWFHLRAGREMWETGSLITRERFSSTAAGIAWQNHEWLSQLLMYAIYAIGGAVLLTVVTGGAAFLAVVGSWRLMRGPFELRLPLLIALAVITPAEWAVRPQALSLLVFMLAVYVVVSDRAQWLPGVVAVWANAHGVAVFGVVLAGVNALDAVLWSGQRRVRAVVVAVLSAAAPMLSPLGWHYWPRVVQTVSEARSIGIQEYRSAFQVAALPFWVLALAFAVVVVRERHRFRSAERMDRLLVLTAAALGLATVTSFRNAPYFALVAAPALSRFISLRLTTSKPRPASRVAVGFVGLAVALAISVVVYRWRDHGRYLGWQPISYAAANAIRDCPGPIFNTYEAGGPLMWFVPQQPVFVDGRVEAYPLELLERSRRADLFADYRQLFHDYAVRCAVVPTGSPMGRALSRDETMRQIFIDDRWTVFALRAPAPPATAPGAQATASSEAVPAAR